MADVIGRDPEAAASSRWDLVVVGGGIQGVMLLLEASRRGLRALLLERDDFGGATSWNSLRILHGGLRYLQSGDLRRFRRSVRARRWFFRHFPDLVRPLPCLMPLYGTGLKRPAVLRGALALNDALSAGRNVGVGPSVHLPGGRVLDRSDTEGRFPAVDRDGLKGGALWFDGLMESPQRILMEALRWACAGRSQALNRIEAVDLETRDGAVRAVVARDARTGDRHAFGTDRVVFCVGPDAGALAGVLGRAPSQVPPAAPAFNVVLRGALPSTGAVAVDSAGGHAVLFAVPLGDLTLAGTVHAPAETDPALEAAPTSRVEGFVADLARAIPGWEAGSRDVVRVLLGAIPGVSVGREDLARHPTIIDLGAEGGPRGAHVVVAVKYTTAPVTAEDVLHRLGVRRGGPAAAGSRRPASAGPVPGAREFLDLVATQPGKAEALVRRLAREEAVGDPEDLVLRRTDWGLDPAVGRDALEAVSGYLQRGDAPAGSR